MLDNPKRSSDLCKTETASSFSSDQNDKPIVKGQSQKAHLRFHGGVINRTTSDRQGAHADYRAAKRVIRNSMPEIVKLVQDRRPALSKATCSTALKTSTWAVQARPHRHYRDPG